jgi:hypothetical protein
MMLQPPRPQQLQKLGRQHGMPVLAALAHLDTDQHALGIDVADPQHDDLAAAQTGAVGDAERGLVLETGTWRGLDQLGDLIWRKDPRQDRQSSGDWRRPRWYAYDSWS